MRLRSALILLALSAPPLAAQTWPVDEGTFVVAKAAAQGFTESFKIKHGPGGIITATGSQTAGTQLTTTSLTTDSLGTPMQYDLRVAKAGAQMLKLHATATGPRRFTASSTASGGEDAMKEYPLAAGRTVVLEPGLLHQLFFLPLAGRNGRVEVLEPGAAHASSAVLTLKGLDNVRIAGKQLTANRYSLTGVGAEADFWIDPQGRLLRVDIPSQGLSATREEPPR
jgi:hypothetical protein